LQEWLEKFEVVQQLGKHFGAIPGVLEDAQLGEEKFEVVQQPGYNFGATPGGLENAQLEEMKFLGFEHEVDLVDDFEVQDLPKSWGSMLDQAPGSHWKTCFWIWTSK
jgi:hypothetical protein